MNMTAFDKLKKCGSLYVNGIRLYIIAKLTKSNEIEIIEGLAAVLERMEKELDDLDRVPTTPMF